MIHSCVPMTTIVPSKCSPNDFNVKLNWLEVKNLSTDGRLATDAYEFVLPIYINDNHFDFDFYVAGWRYYEGDRLINHLKRDDLVALDFDPDNPEDNKAILVSSVNGCTLGY